MQESLQRTPFVFTCMLDLTKTVPSRFRLLSSNHWTRTNSLHSCLGPRHSFIHSELSPFLAFSLATFLHKQWIQQLTTDMSVDISTGQCCVHKHGHHCRLR